MSKTLEAAISELPGVRRVKVDIGSEGVESLRVLVIPERSTAKTLDEVQAILAQAVEHPIDGTRIQVIRTGAHPGAHRRKLSSLGLDRSEGRFSARASLELSGDILVGESASPQGKLFERRTIAEAIVNGAHELISFAIEVQRVYIIPDVESAIAVVVLARGSEVIVGSAVVRNDEYDAIARATLDALNRFTIPIEEEQPVAQ
ncbi:MAG: hypothetical protein M3161_01170 [Actinomycetota bacterium]|nr:hypothetical protein [Actinomycetota bacterium]